MKKFIFISLYILIIAHIAVLCVYAAEVKSAPVTITPVPPVSSESQSSVQQQIPLEKGSESSYKYYPLGKPDPFKPFVEVEIAAKKAQERKVSVYPLERDEIEKFKLSGIIGDHIQRLAIVEIIDEGKLKFYPILKGTRIGIHSGKVSEIMADRVIINEPDKNNKIRRIILKLHKDDEVKP